MIPLNLQSCERTKSPRESRSFAPFIVGLEALRTNETRMSSFVFCSLAYRSSDI